MGPETEPPSERLVYCWPSARAARSVHCSDGASKLRLLLRRMKLEPLPLRTLSCAAAESAAAHVVRRRHEARGHLRVARQRGGAEVGAVERHAVLVGREPEHGEAGRVALGAEDRRDARDRGGDRVEVALLIGRDTAALLADCSVPLTSGVRSLRFTRSRSATARTVSSMTMRESSTSATRIS